MVYRAKITAIQDIIKSWDVLAKCPIVRDAKDVYIEVRDEVCAALIDQLNGNVIASHQCLDQMERYL